MKDNISPEEKLLRLIRKDKGPEAIKEKKTSAMVTDKTLESKDTSLRITGSGISRFVPKKIILLAFLISCLFFAITFSTPYLDFIKMSLPQISPPIAYRPKTESKDKVKPYEFYVEGIKNHQIFNLPAPQAVVQPVGSGPTVDLTKDITLIGIIADEEPQAIIEDKKAKKTYYVRKGQFVGNFQIMDIQEGKILLSDGEKSFELYL